tara:strand:- start:449 stop:814 length:366 start_codon:yes stop_codon:yes gene_type:complete
VKTPKYRNKFEAQAAEVLKDLCGYETKKIPYTIHRNYIPDFVGMKGKFEILIEAKGFFRVGDVQKYKAIRDSLPKKKQLVFLLYNPNKKLRKGSKMNMAEWCDKEGLKWYTLENIVDVFNN